MTGTHGARPGRRPVELVDARTKTAHFLTLDAYDEGLHSPGVGYVALCGAEVAPAAMVEPGQGYCWPCRSAIYSAPRLAAPRAPSWWLRLRRFGRRAR